MHKAIQRALISVVIATSACASAASGPARNRNIITAAQIGGIQARTAYDAVQTLQPQWLSSRGPTSVTDPTPTTATVYLDGSLAGDLEFLRSILIADVAEIRYFPAGEAATRFGIGHPRGVIEVISQGRRD